MRDTSRTLGRRQLIGGCAGFAAAAAVSHPVSAQQNESTDDTGTTTAENGTAGNATATNETGQTDTVENETLQNESVQNGTAANETAANATAEGTGSEMTEGGGASGSAGGLSTEGIVAVFGGVLATALLSPLIFALIMKAVYEDDKPTQEPGLLRRS